MQYAPIAPKNSIYEINSLGENHFNNFLWLLRLPAYFLKYDHPDRPAYWQMIIWMDWPFANDYQDWTSYCKWSSWSTSILQMILLFLLIFISSAKKHIFPLQIFPSFSSVNLLPCKKIFSVSKYIPHFSFSVLFSPEKIFSFIKCYLHFISPQ